jgi:hypothetical protein
VKSKDGQFLLAIVVVGWISNYLHFRDFGFYEDDWFFFAGSYVTGTREWFAQMTGAVTRFVDGRPVHIAEMYLFGYIGAVFSSIAVLYVIAFVFFASSSVLMYCVLRLRYPPLFCGLSTIVFVMSPLTTLRQFLNGQLTFGPAFVCAFGAILLFCSERRVWSYIVSLVALLTYEPTFLLFSVAPVFGRGRDRKRQLRRVTQHVAVCAALAVIYAVARYAFGQNRQLASIAEMPWIDKVSSTILYDLLFTVSTVKSYIYGMYVGFCNASLEGVLYLVILFLPITARLWCIGGRRITRFFGRTKHGLARARWWLKHGVGTGVLLTVVGYAFAYFTLYHDWMYPLSGRDTRVSVAASVGNSMLVSSCVIISISLCRARWTRAIMYSAVGAVLCALFLYSMVVQDDYVEEWRRQREFLTQLVMLSPDVTWASYVIVRVPWISETLLPWNGRRRSIGYQPHGLQVSTGSLFLDQAPQIFVVYSDDWQKYMRFEGGKLYWTSSTFPGGWGRNTKEGITPGEIIVFEERTNGTLVRSDVPITVPDCPIPVNRIFKVSGAKPESDWVSFGASGLLHKVVPAFVSSAVMVNSVGNPFGVRAGGPRRTVKLAVKFPPRDMPPKDGLSDPLVVVGRPGRADFVEVYYYGDNTLRLRIDHWGFPGVESESMRYDPGRVYFVDVVMGHEMVASIVGGGIKAVYRKKPYSVPNGQVAIGHNPVGGGITTAKFSGEVVTAEIVE